MQLYFLHCWLNNNAKFGHRFIAINGRFFVVASQDLETALAHHAPPPAQDDPSLYELPPLVIDGIPTPVEKMTQAQLRAFIPLMLKFSTGEHGDGRRAVLIVDSCTETRTESRNWMLSMKLATMSDRSRQTRLGKGIDAAAVVAGRSAVGQRPHGRPFRRRQTAGQ